MAGIRNFKIHEYGKQEGRRVHLHHRYVFFFIENLVQDYTHGRVNVSWNMRRRFCVYGSCAGLLLSRAIVESGYITGRRHSEDVSAKLQGIL